MNLQASIKGILPWTCCRHKVTQVRLNWSCVYRSWDGKKPKGLRYSSQRWPVFSPIFPVCLEGFPAPSVISSSALSGELACVWELSAPGFLWHLQFHSSLTLGLALWLSIFSILLRSGLVSRSADMRNTSCYKMWAPVCFRSFWCHSQSLAED